MSAFKHDPPLHVAGFEVPGRIPAAFSTVARGADPTAGYEVQDSRGEAIAFFRAVRTPEAVTVQLNGPSLDATAVVAASTRSAPVVFEAHGRTVLEIRPTPAGYDVSVPDLRVDVRVAGALVLTLDRLLAP